MYHDNLSERVTVRFSKEELKDIIEYLDRTGWPFSLSKYIRYCTNYLTFKSNENK